MAGTNFLGSLLEFKKDIINEETIELMDPYIRMEDYDHPTAVRVCGNVAGLLSWTVAMTNFFAINGFFKTFTLLIITPSDEFFNILLAAST